MSIRVIVADDQQLIRAGVVMLLTAVPDLEVVAEASDGDAAVALAGEHHPDVVVMDIRMAGTDGIAATRRLTADQVGESVDRPTRVLVLTTFAEDEVLYGALQAGASGFLLKHAAPSDLAAAIRKVAGGDAWIDPAVAGRVIAAVSHLRTTPGATDLESMLTPREVQVLTLIAYGLSNREITDRLVLSEATVKTHVARVIMKTGCRDRAQAVALAYQSGLVQPPRRPSRR
ncbi:MAG TPA: response regulator transcription factor [Cellulomonas sp.]